jgi:hypothetical protein
VDKVFAASLCSANPLQDRPGTVGRVGLLSALFDIGILTSPPGYQRSALLIRIAKPPVPQRVDCGSMRP